MERVEEFLRELLEKELAETMEGRILHLNPIEGRALVRRVFAGRIQNIQYVWTRSESDGTWSWSEGEPE